MAGVLQGLADAFPMTYAVDGVTRAAASAAWDGSLVKDLVIVAVCIPWHSGWERRRCNVGRMKARRGRRIAGGDTRAEILVVARAMFGESGYTSTTLRGVALRAGVDPALILHHFGSKEALFRNAMHITFDPAAIAAIISNRGGGSPGERICLYFLELWEDDATREPLLAMLRSALTHDAAAELLREFLSEALVLRVAMVLDAADAPLRATLVGSQLVGLAMARYLLRIEPLASADPATVVAWIAPTLDRYLTRDQLGQG